MIGRAVSEVVVEKKLEVGGVEHNNFYGDVQVLVGTNVVWCFLVLLANEVRCSMCFFCSKKSEKILVAIVKHSNMRMILISLFSIA